MKFLKNNWDFEVTTTTVIDVNDVASLLCNGFEGGMATWCQVGEITEPEKKAKFSKDMGWGSHPLYSYPLVDGGFV